MKKLSPFILAAYSGFIFVLVYLVYYLKKVDVSLIYTWQQTIPLSLGESLKIPGGLAGFLADVILEYTVRPVWGSVFMALLLTAVFFSLKILFKKESGKALFYPLLFAALIPFISLFAYYRMPFELLCSIALALFLGMVRKQINARKLAMRSLLNFISALVVYAIAGVPGLLVFLQAIIIQVVYSRSFKDLIYVIPLVLIPLLYLPFNLSLSFKQAFLGPMLVSQYDEIPLVFYFSLWSPLLLLLLFSLGNIVQIKFTMSRSLFFSTSGIMTVLAVLVFFSLGCINEVEKDGYSIFEASFNEDWEEVLKRSEETEFINQVLQFEINRALYGSGLLLENLFHYPQKYAENGLFLEGISSSHVAVHTAALYYDLGFANEARHWATEAQMVLVRHPVVLKQLIISYLAIGQEEAAEKYLQVLSGSRLYRSWCDHVKTMIESKQLDDDPDIRFFRMNNPSNDFFAGTRDPHQKLMLFYSLNGNNDAAFEFLVASYLLQHNLGGVVALLPQFKAHGHETFPKAVEEALMIYLSRGGSNSSALTDYAISKNTVEEFRDFNKLLANVDSKAERMKKASKYKNTYWYYLLFSSPYAKK